MLDRYKLVIFDLDGTLYEGTDHFDYYAEKLKENVAASQKDMFSLDYEAMKSGRHIVQIGKVYDVNRDLVLTMDPMTLRVTEAHTWEGASLSEIQTHELYPQVLSFDFENMIAIGDGWWYPFVCAKHHGVVDCYDSYVATKEYMVSDDFSLIPLARLVENIRILNGKTQTVVVTNSDADDVARLFRELGLTGAFEHVVTSAKKPAQTTTLFKQLLQQYDVQPEEAVSIGDNFINEVAPAVLLGMDAVYIHPQRPVVDHKKVRVVTSVVDLF
ncbi:HAD family hydrolase [Bacillus sp. FSL W7-1360]